MEGGGYLSFSFLLPNLRHEFHCFYLDLSISHSPSIRNYSRSSNKINFQYLVIRRQKHFSTIICHHHPLHLYTDIFYHVDNELLLLLLPHHFFFGNKMVKQSHKEEIILKTIMTFVNISCMEQEMSFRHTWYNYRFHGRFELSVLLFVVSLSLCHPYLSLLNFDSFIVICILQY